MCESRMRRVLGGNTGSTGGQVISTLLELFLQYFGILDDLVSILFELWFQSLSQRHGQSSDRMVVWTTLMTRENTEIDLFLEIVQDCFC